MNLDDLKARADVVREEFLAEPCAKLQTYEQILVDAQAMDANTDPDGIENLAIEASVLPAISCRKVLETIKKQTGTPLGELKAAARDAQPVQPDQLDLARSVIAAQGHGNLLTAGPNTYHWNESGVWRQLEQRGVKQMAQYTLSEGSGEAVTASLVTAIADLVQTEVYRPDHTFNIGDPEAVNCLNGEIVLSDGKWTLQPHKREHYRTTQIPVHYDPDAQAPRFRQFMSEIFRSDPDADGKAQALLEMIGYTLMAHCRHEKFIILVGTGANGKSVLLAVIEMLCGPPSVAGVQPSEFGNRFQRGYLRDKLANIVTEIRQGETIEDAALKGIVSGEPATVEEKHKDPYTLRPFSTCWFGTNHMPHTRDFSDALFRRALVLQFSEVFKPENGNCDPLLKDKLGAELPGILTLALDAYARALQHGFTMPESCEQARRDWRLEADQVAQFVVEDCSEDPAGEVQASVLFDHYMSWADENGIHRKVTLKSFRDRLTGLGYGNRRTPKARMVTGLRVGKATVCPKCDGDGCQWCKT